MLVKAERKCRNCNKRPPHTWRRDCLECIRKKEKNAMVAKKTSEKQRIKVKKEKLTDKKRFSRSNLIKEADRIASLYVRERDRGKPCVTCLSEWNEFIQNWHFASRRHLSTRWHEKNMHGQCPHCNCWWAGEQFKHWLAIDRMYWIGTAEHIMRLALSIEKVTDDEILHYIRLYYYELPQMGWSNEQIKIKKYYL